MGGLRLLIAFLILFLGVVVLVQADDSGAGYSTPPSVSAGPPKAKVAPVEDMVQGHKIVDRYRYLEDANDPDTKLYVEEELSYTRALLDPLPGRDKINARLAQLLAIGTVSAPQMGGKYYFYTRREGNQNQPILYVRERVQGEGCLPTIVCWSMSTNWRPTGQLLSTGGLRLRTGSTLPMERRRAAPRSAPYA